MLDINDTLRVSRRASREDDAVTRTSKGKSFHARLGGSCPSGSSRSFRVSLASHPSPMSTCLSTAGGRNFATCRTVPFPRARSSLFSLSLPPPLSFSSIHDPSREFEISSEEMRAKLARRDVSQRIKSTLAMNLSMIIKPGLFTTKCRLRLRCVSYECDIFIAESNALGNAYIYLLSLQNFFQNTSYEMFWNITVQRNAAKNPLLYNFN